MLCRKAPPRPAHRRLRAAVVGTAAFLGMRVMACGGAAEPSGSEGGGSTGFAGCGLGPMAGSMPTSGGVTGSGSGYPGAYPSTGTAEKESAPIEFDKVIGEP